MNCLSLFGPLPFAFPDSEAEWRDELVPKSLMKQVADIFNGRIFEEVVPGTVIEFRERLPQARFQVTKIHDHAVSHRSVHDKFNFVGMTMVCPAFGMVRKEVSTINVLDDANSHAARGE